MKQILQLSLLTLFVLFMGSSASFAQCVPDPGVPPVAGVYPDTLATAQGCTPYDVTITFYLPRDTVVPGIGSIPFNHFIIEDIVGLPNGFTWECNLDSNGCFYDVSPNNPSPDTLGCVTITGSTNIPGVYSVTVIVTANVAIVGDQTVPFVVPLLVTPCPIVGDCYELLVDQNCQPTTLEVTNAFDSTASVVDGIDYFWDYGDGTTSIDPNPPTHTYTNPGTYVFESMITIDTTGWVLNNIFIDAYNCTDGLGGGGPDLYWIFFDPNGNELANTSGSTLDDGPATPISTGIGPLVLEPGVYEFQLWDEDTPPINADDGCATNSNGSGASITFAIPFTGSTTISQDGLTLTLDLARAIDTLTCSDTIVVDALPDVPEIVVTGDSVICEGDSVILVTTSTDSLEWRLDDVPIVGANEQTFIAFDAGEYTVVAIDADNFCRAASSDVVRVEVNSIAVPTIAANNCDLSTTATGVDYQWYVDGTPVPGANSFNHVAMLNGSYTIEVTDPMTGCSATSASIDLMCEPQSIDDLLDVINDVSVYPNPNTGTLFVDFTLFERQDVDIRITDIYGKTVKLQNMGQSMGDVNTSFDLEGLAQGIYILSIELEKGTINEKIILQ